MAAIARRRGSGAVRGARPRASPPERGRAGGAGVLVAERGGGGRQLRLHGRPPRRGARAAVRRARLQQHRPRPLRSARGASGGPARAARHRARRPGCSATWPRSPPGRARTPRSGCSPSCGPRASTRTSPWSGQIAFGGSGVRYDNHAFLESLRAPRPRARRGRRRALPRPARRRAARSSPSWTSRSCRHGRSPSASRWSRAWPWDAAAGDLCRSRPRARGGSA